MIIVEERDTRKVPGITSFFVSFNYNQDIVNEISKLDCGKDYSKKRKEWEIPTCNLGALLDSLCKYDDITLKLLKETKQTKELVPMATPFKTKPFQYQLEGIEYGLSHKKWLLLDEMGLGKSLSAIYIAESLYKANKIEHCLIVCGVNSLKSNWRKEIHTHSDLSAVILGERLNRKGILEVNPSMATRINHLKTKINEFFIITNIESFRNPDLVEAINSGPNKIDMIIVDEIHKAKDINSQQASNLVNLEGEYKLGMTGTLLMNDPLDTYVPLKWIGADRSTLTNFKSTYCTFGDTYHSIIVGYKNLNMLKDQLNQFSLRRLKSDVLDLPPKNIIEEYVDMDPKHASFYNNIKQGIIDEVDKVRMTTSSLLAMVTRLRQATSCPSILTTEKIPPTKLIRAAELVDQIIKGGDKVVVFSTFVEPIKILNEMLKEYNPLLNIGEISDAELSNNVDTFQYNKGNPSIYDPNRKVFLGTWQKCGTGLTLTEAKYMIFIDTPWTSSIYKQAQDRIYRIGTKEPVFIYNLICKDTIDERVLDILNAKQALSDYVIDDSVSQDSLNILRKYIEDLP